jgi:gluconokinase
LASVLTLDIGSSSARALLYSGAGEEMEGFEAREQYHARTTEDGGWEIGAAELTAIASKTLDAICAQLRTRGLKPDAVAVDTFWHSILGVAADGTPVTPVLHPFDSRSAAAARELAKRIDNATQHRRTGCMLHPSYPPAKLIWLKETQQEVFQKAARWMTFGEYLFLELFGVASCSTSMASASGLWNQNAGDYDREMIEALPITRDQLASPEQMDEPQRKLQGAFRQRWPELDGIPWFPALGDGACDNVGSGCGTRDRFALMVGTSGAMRACVETNAIEIPPGLFCYRVDRRRFVLGGALSNGGEVFAWMRRTLQLPGANEIEKQLAGLPPGQHGLTIVPLFAGERSPGWRADAHAAIAGLGAGTSPLEILHAALESVALTFRDVYELMEPSLGAPKEVIASGGALLHSRVWTQMMADTLCHTVIQCLEPEATSRGAALMALERIGAIPSINDPAPKLGARITPDASKQELYQAALERQRRLYRKLFEENSSERRSE